MTASVVVTVEERRTGFRADMELPAALAAGELSAWMARALAASFPDHFRGITDLALFYQDEQIKEDETLSSYGIWDGSIIELKRR